LSQGLRNFTQSLAECQHELRKDYRHLIAELNCYIPRGLRLRVETLSGTVKEKKMSVNQRISNVEIRQEHTARDNLARLEVEGVLGVNLMAAPGAGKTSLIQRTVEVLSPSLRIGIVEATPSVGGPEPLYESEVPWVQVTTGAAPHLDAAMLSQALRRIPLTAVDILLVENVGNLIREGPCELGLQANVIIASVPEGDDKPYRYSEIYRDADAVILNKTDLLGSSAFDIEFFRRGVELIKPGVPVFPLSCRTGADLYRWIDWLALTRKYALATMTATSGR
jgi:hydrogenase nickel incorporation protein HypB